MYIHLVFEINPYSNTLLFPKFIIRTSLSSGNVLEYYCIEAIIQHLLYNDFILCTCAIDFVGVGRSMGKL